MMHVVTQISFIGQQQLIDTMHLLRVARKIVEKTHSPKGVAMISIHLRIPVILETSLPRYDANLVGRYN